MTTEPREASWSAPALWRFGRAGENGCAGQGNRRCQNQFGLDERGKGRLKFFPDRYYSPPNDPFGIPVATSIARRAAIACARNSRIRSTSTRFASITPEKYVLVEP